MSCVRFVLCELRRVLVRVRTENARSSSPPPRRPSQPDADFDAACAAERRRCAAESLGPDCACLLGADDNGLRFPASVEAGAFEAMVRHMTGSPELRAAVLDARSGPFLPLSVGLYSFSGPCITSWG